MTDAETRTDVETQSGPIAVALVDDQTLVRSGFTMLIDSQPDLQVVAQAGDGAAALTALQSTAADVVLMDVRMPVLDGIEATREIINGGSATRVIILTTFDLDEYAFAGLRAGASAFLLKNVTPEDLVQAVRIVASGDAVVAPRATARLLENFVRPAPAAAPADGTGEGLTEREVEVIRCLTAGLSNAEIAAKLFLSEATVKTHVRRILTKLELRDRVQVVVFAYEHGIVVPGR